MEQERAGAEGRPGSARRVEPACGPNVSAAGGRAEQAVPGGSLDEEHRREAEAALARIERILERAEGLEPGVREQLRAATAALAEALHPSWQGEAARGRTVAGLAEVLVHEAARPEPDRTVIERAIAALDEAARPLESRSPALVQTVGRIAEVLAGLGI
ncbi:MAG: hypothetical protein KatS3mg102_2044 [Planctomycetota bacterium]|nr:MAG: hypothetical protein KatS3mg102_2044 [Planctomycetota bacterium]